MAVIYVETVFGLHGLGALSVGRCRVAPVVTTCHSIVAIVAVVGTFVVLLNVAGDVAGAWLDPRIRARSQGPIRCHALSTRARACGSHSTSQSARHSSRSRNRRGAPWCPVGHGGTTRAARPRGQARLGRRDADRGDDHNTELAARPSSGTAISRPRCRRSRSAKKDGACTRPLANVGSVPVQVAPSAPHRNAGRVPEPAVLADRPNRQRRLPQLIPLPATTFAPSRTRDPEAGHHVARHVQRARRREEGDVVLCRVRAVHLRHALRPAALLDELREVRQRLAARPPGRKTAPSGCRLQIESPAAATGPIADVGKRSDTPCRASR